MNMGNWMHIAMIGTRGVPAQYGGFETAVEEVGKRLVARGHRVTVYCRNEGQTMTEFLGMELVNMPALRKRSLETLSHTALSARHATRPKNRPDAAVVFNAANAPFLARMRKAGIPTAVHMDGIEWKRQKWAGAGAKYYRWAERKAATEGLALIADAQGIADHLRDTYRRHSYVIAYGAPILYPKSDLLKQHGLETGGYHLIVARMEPENHVHMIVEGYAQSGSDVPLVVVGGASYGDEYMERVNQLAGDSDTRFVGSVWDQGLLNQLYGNARSYLHGHSVGGTNPSLLRALGCAAPVSAYDVNFNREVTAGHARFFGTPEEVAAVVRADDADVERALLRGKAGQDHVSVAYRWDDVTDGYEQMLLEIAGRKERATLTLVGTRSPRLAPPDLGTTARRAIRQLLRDNASGEPCLRM
jgi:glycosyltransferase involved in cell wall biosynthesis